MSKVKYRVREFTPKANQGGTHSFFAEAVISTDIDVHITPKEIVIGECIEFLKKEGYVIFKKV